MTRSLRIEFPGAVYHITSRGNARQPIYLNDEDRKVFLDLLSQVVDRFHWLCHAYCLMDNHYHLLLEMLHPTLSLGMRQLNGVYTQLFNRRHKRTGHLFQGRFKAILVEKEAHLLELCRYVVLNPVRAHLVKDPAEWPWSSYQTTLGQVPKPTWLTTDWILAQFGATRQKAEHLYREFVSSQTNASSPWEKLRGQIFLGSDEFCLRFSQDLPLEEVPREQCQPVRPSLNEIFSGDDERTQQVTLAYKKYGYRMKEIALHLGVHYATISRWVRTCESEENRTKRKMFDCKT